MAANQDSPEEIGKQKGRAAALKYRHAHLEQTRANDRAWHKANRERDNKTRAKLYVADPEKFRQRSRDDHKANLEKRHATQKKWRDANSEQIREAMRKYREENREQIRERTAKYRKEHLSEINERLKTAHAVPARLLRRSFQNAKIRARARGFEFGADVRDAFMANPPTECSCCRAALDYSRGPLGVGQRGPRNRAPSLDRFDNAKGYVLGNVKVICFRCNKLKSNASLAELEAVVAYMRGDVGHGHKVLGVEESVE